MDDSMKNLKYHYMDKKVIEVKVKTKVDFSNSEGIKILKENDFIQEDQAIYLTKEGMNKVIAEFESKMSQTIKKDNSEMLCRDIVFKQANLYKSVLAAKEEEYIPYKYK